MLELGKTMRLQKKQRNMRNIPKKTKKQKKKETSSNGFPILGIPKNVSITYT